MAVSVVMIAVAAGCGERSPLPSSGRVLNIETRLVSLSNFDADGDLIALNLMGPPSIVRSVSGWRTILDLEDVPGVMGSITILRGSPCTALGGSMLHSSRTVQIDCHSGLTVGEFEPARDGRSVGAMSVISPDGRCTVALAVDGGAFGYDLVTKKALAQSANVLPRDPGTIVAATGVERGCRFLFVIERTADTAAGGSPIPETAVTIGEADLAAGTRRTLASLTASGQFGPPSVADYGRSAVTQVSPSGRYLALKLRRELVGQRGTGHDSCEIVDLETGALVRALRNPESDQMIYDFAWVDDTHIALEWNDGVVVANITSGEMKVLPMPRDQGMDVAIQIEYASKSRLLAVRGDRAVWFYRIPEKLP